MTAESEGTVERSLLETLAAVFNLSIVMAGLDPAICDSGGTREGKNFSLMPGRHCGSSGQARGRRRESEGWGMGVAESDPSLRRSLWRKNVPPLRCYPGEGRGPS